MVDHQETRRKAIHMLGGLGPPVAIFLFGWAGSVAILLFLLTYIMLGGILNLRGIRLPVIAGLIENTQRATERFPLTAVEFLASVLVIGSLFHEFWFFPAIAVMAFGDGAAGLVGIHYGRHKLPWNRRKSWEGLGAGIAAGIAGVVVLTLLGVELHERGYEASPLLGSHWVAPVAFIIIAFTSIVGATAVFTRQRTAANPVAPLTFTLLAAGIGLLVAATPLVLLSMGLIKNGPLVPFDALPMFALPGFLVYYGAAAAVVAMCAETTLRRHDNVAIPFLFLMAMILLAQWDPLVLSNVGN